MVSVFFMSWSVLPLYSSKSYPTKSKCVSKQGRSLRLDWLLCLFAWLYKTSQIASGSEGRIPISQWTVSHPALWLMGLWIQWIDEFTLCLWGTLYIGMITTVTQAEITSLALHKEPGLHHQQQSRGPIMWGSIVDEKGCFTKLYGIRLLQQPKVVCGPFNYRMLQLVLWQNEWSCCVWCWCWHPLRTPATVPVVPLCSSFQLVAR